MVEGSLMLTNHTVDDSTVGINMAGIYFLMAGWTAKAGLVMKSSIRQDSMVGADVEVTGYLRGNQAVNGVLVVTDDLTAWVDTQASDLLRHRSTVECDMVATGCMTDG